MLGHRMNHPDRWAADLWVSAPLPASPYVTVALVLHFASLPGEARAVSHRSTGLANPKGHFRCGRLSALILCNAHVMRIGRQGCSPPGLSIDTRTAPGQGSVPSATGLALQHIGAVSQER